MDFDLNFRINFLSLKIFASNFLFFLLLVTIGLFFIQSHQSQILKKINKIKQKSDYSGIYIYFVTFKIFYKLIEQKQLEKVVNYHGFLN